MRTVYVVIKDGAVVDAKADHLTDVVVIDLNTTDPQMLKVAKEKLEELESDNNIADCEIL